MGETTDRFKDDLSETVSRLGETVEKLGSTVKQYVPVSEFRRFLKNYNVVGMAIGIVMGAAVTKLVNSAVQSVVMPLISLALPRGEWEKAGFILRHEVKDAVDPDKILYPAVKILYGDLISTAINFIVIAILVFLFAKYVLREEKVAKK